MESNSRKRKEREEDTNIHGSTIFVSNLPYTTTSADLQKMFSNIAPIRSAFVVTKQGTSISKGVGYVAFALKEDAESAFANISENGIKLVGRKLRVQWARSKEKWKSEKAKFQEDAAMHDVSESKDDAEDDEGCLGSHSGEDDEDRNLHSGEDEGRSLHSGEDDEDRNLHSGEDEGRSLHSGEDDEGRSLHSGEDDEDRSDLDDEEENEEEGVKLHLPQPQAGETLFIRNIPFNGTEDELRTLFSAFGPLRYARITLDPATGRSRGTGFACFWNLEDANRVVQQSEILRSETTGHSTVPKKNPFSLPSILTPDPSSSMAQSLVLHGRTLDVVRAVTREVASKLKEDNERMREKADKRNLYLLREGVIMPNTPSAELLTSADVERRTSSFNARRALLKSNPSLFISKTRLSVRQIPIFVTERMLKRLASHAVKAFESEVKQGSRQPLTADELARVLTPEELTGMLVDGDAMEANKQKDKKRNKFKGRDTGVKQAKIVRQAERVDSLTGKGRSKGYGFVEMNKHTDALRLLRWANNNPDVGPLFDVWWKDELENLLKLEKAKPESEKDDARVKRLKQEIDKSAGDGKKKSKSSLIVEFSIENIQVMQRRNASQKDQAAIHTNSKILERKDEVDIKKSEEPPAKKQRTKEKQIAKAAVKANPKVKTANPLGALIGRKRKERKSGKK